MQLRFVFALCVLAFASAKQEGARDTLVQALDQIEGRIRDTNRTDKAVMNEIENNVTRDDAILADRITRKEAEISDKQAEIAGYQAEIERLQTLMQQNRQQQLAATQTRTAKQQEIVDGDAQRAAEHALWVEYDSDCDVAIKAIAEVKDIVTNSKLQANEGDDASDFANKTLRATTDEEIAAAASTALTEKASQLLKKLSARVNDTNVQSFIQMAALSATTLEGDVSRLLQLLDDLNTELGDYRTELDNNERQAAIDWDAEKTALTNEIKQLTATIDRLDAEFAELSAALGVQQGLLQTAQQELAQLQQELADLNAQKDALHQMAQDERDEFADRVARRDEELDTLNSIRQIIDTKLQAKSGTDAAKLGMNYQGSDGYRWQLGSWDNVECVVTEDTAPMTRNQARFGTRTRDAYCMKILEDGSYQQTDDEVLCGPKPNNVVEACREGAF